MEAAEKSWRPLGELLLAKNLIAPNELEQALREQEESGRLLGAILVDRGFISGPALAIALAEQYGVQLDQQKDFATRLQGELERGHRPEPGAALPAGDLEPVVEATVVMLEPPHPPPLEAVPDPDPDPKLEQLESENRRLQEEIERLREEFTKLRLIESAAKVEEEPEPEPPSAHLLFVPTPARYLLVERQGPPPAPGAEVALSEGSFVVRKLGRAPVPGELRPCAFLVAR